ncbi:hypothetical protein J6V86_03220 [bacterium]|nr:hypothetical protein [bacterium]
MKKPILSECLLTPEAVKELMKFEVDGKEISSYIHYTLGSNSIYIEVEKDNFTIVSERIIEKVLDANPTLEVVRPVNSVPIKPFNCSKTIAVSFIYFKKKPFWKRLSSRKK